MKRTQLRQKLCRQIQLIEIHLTVAGTSGTPVAGGLDVAIVESVEDLGIGNYKINLKDVAQRNLVPASLLVSTAGLLGRVTASDKSSITVQLATPAGAATDGDLNISILFSEARDLY